MTGRIKRTVALLSSGGRSLLGGRYRGLLDSSAVVEFGRKLLATRLDRTELVLEPGNSAVAVELGHQAVVALHPGQYRQCSWQRSCKRLRRMRRSEPRPFPWAPYCLMGVPNVLSEVYGGVEMSVIACEQKKYP